MLDDIHTPNGWNIIEQVLDSKTDYYVFGSFSGGYLDGDSWRRNSGIKKIEEHEEYYLIHGFSGSVYKCYKNGEGRISVYNVGVLAHMCENSIPQATVVMLEDMKNLINEKGVEHD